MLDGEINYLGERYHSINSLRAASGGKKKSVKKLIDGKKRVIHIGPKGGKYYIRIRNGKKVKVYI